MDMKNDIFGEQTFGKLAIRKIAPAELNFRLYKAGWIGKANERQVMEVSGAVFREAQRGPRKGQLSIMVPHTSRTVHVTADEMDAFEADARHNQ